MNECDLIHVIPDFVNGDAREVDCRNEAVGTTGNVLVCEPCSKICRENGLRVVFGID